MTQRHLWNAYLNEDGQSGFYVDCPTCHFYKNGIEDIGGPCRNRLCTTGVVIQVNFTVQPPLRAVTPCDIIIADTNIGTDTDPVMRVMVEADADSCDFSTPFCDDEGVEHDPHDWWVTGEDIRRYEAMHAAYHESQRS
jgi:hypothetical protein